MDLWRSWHPPENNFAWDVAQYYSYLPAKFCNNNSFDFKNGIEAHLPFSPLKERMSKMTYGMSVLYAPFFALGYKIAYNQKSPLDGFSEPFSTCIHWGSIFYGLMGLIFLRNFLVKFYNELTVTLTLAICFLGTTLFYYVMGNSEMSHGYLFFLISAFLLLTYHWYRKPGIIKSIFAGSLLGLISLVRPTEIFVGLIFLLWNVTNKKELKEQALKLWRYKWHLLLMTVIIILIWLPQLLFWKARTGSYFFFSYEGEKFFWTDPQIINILFSYRKGWVTYSPLIILAFIGFFLMRNDAKKLRPVIVSLLILNIYVLSCWWNWFFGGGFGARGFTQHITYLSIPVAASCDFFMNSENFRRSLQFLRIVFFVFIFSGISLCLGQSYQYSQAYIHYNSMTKETYWFVLGKYYLDGNENAWFYKNLKDPDNKKLSSGEDRDQ
jgi:hypothetical protein